MPSQAETIAALQGLNPVTTPQSPADPTAAAMTFGSAVGLPDAIRALKGQLTPEEAQQFALTSAMGLLPGSKAETAAVKTMGELLPHMYPATSMFAKMTPKEYLTTMGEGLPAKLPQELEQVLKPAMPPPKVGTVPSAVPVKAFEPKPIGPDEISAALAKNPGASIFDIAGTHVSGPSQPYTPKGKGIYSEQNVTHLVDYPSIPREAVPYTPLAASILGRSENLAHGTRIPLSRWQGGEDMLKLPDDEIGVHFGNPKQASHFTSNYLGGAGEPDPRSYPVVVATNNSLRMPDMGTWHVDDMTHNLRMQFPEDENLLRDMDDISDVRKYLQAKGYDSIVYKNKTEDPGQDSFIKFTESPDNPGFVTGVRSPWAAFDPNKLSHASLAAGLAGGGMALPAIDPNLLKALAGDQQQ